MFNIDRFKTSTVGSVTITKELVDGEWIFRATGRTETTKFIAIEVSRILDVMGAVTHDATVVFDFDDEVGTTYDVTPAFIGDNVLYRYCRRDRHGLHGCSEFHSQRSAISAAWVAFCTN